MGFHFRRRYNLPPTDPRWLDATIEEVVTDYWAHAHADDPELRNQESFETEGFEEELEAMEAEAAAAPKDESGEWDEVIRDDYSS